jgi:beta-N-acetylhexosaminidase
VVDTTVTADGPDVAVYRRLLQGGPAAVMVSSAIYQNIDPSAPAVFSPTVVGLARSLVGPERDDRHRRPPSAQAVQAWSSDLRGALR